MTLSYRFKKEKLDSGQHVSRPRIAVVLSGDNGSIEVPALIDTGCDITVVPEGIARAIGVDLSGAKSEMFAFRESSEVIESKLDITFIGKVERQSITLQKVPVLIVLSSDNHSDETDINLGVAGIFDAFNISFKKSNNRIVMKKVSASIKYQHKV